MKNQSREFATKDDAERRKFALEQGGDAADPSEVNFPADGPRDPDRMGRGHQDPDEEVADPERRDGPAAQLDDEQHDRNVDGA